PKPENVAFGVTMWATPWLILIVLIVAGGAFFRVRGVLRLRSKRREEAGRAGGDQAQRGAGGQWGEEAGAKGGGGDGRGGGRGRGERGGPGGEDRPRPRGGGLGGPPGRSRYTVHSGQAAGAGTPAPDGAAGRAGHLDGDHHGVGGAARVRCLHWIPRPAA